MKNKMSIREKAGQYYIQGKITLTEAAKQSNLTLWEMERYLIEEGFKSEYSLEELERELKILKKK